VFLKAALPVLMFTVTASGQKVCDAKAVGAKGDGITKVKAT
jgi:hypothetical protein